MQAHEQHPGDAASQGCGLIPTITTERLILRALSPDDLDAYTAINADPQMRTYTGDGRPPDRESTWRAMALLLGHWHLRGYGMWAMVERATGAFIGRAGLYNQEGWPGLEVAWTVARHRWSNGFATEAGQAALDYAFQVVGAEHVISIIHPDNIASIRVAEKLGLEAKYSTSHDGQPRTIYGITRSPRCT